MLEELAQLKPLDRLVVLVRLEPLERIPDHQRAERTAQVAEGVHRARHTAGGVTTDVVTDGP